MTDQFPHIDQPALVTDVPVIQHRLETRRIQALWPLRNIHRRLDGDGIQYAVLTVTHSVSRRAYGATINHEDHFPRGVRARPFDAAPVGQLIRTGRFSQKGLQAAFDNALQTLRDQIAAGDTQLQAYFQSYDDPND